MARRTKAEAEKTKSALLASAVVLFSEQGVAKTTLDDIATAAGVTKGAFYWHFKNKTELLLAIRDRYITFLERGLFIDKLKQAKDITAIINVWSDFFKVFEHSEEIHRFKKVVVKCDDANLFIQLLVDEHHQLEGVRQVVAESLAALPASAWQSAKVGNCQLIANMVVDYVDSYIYRQIVVERSISAQEIIESVKIIFRGGGVIVVD